MSSRSRKRASAHVPPPESRPVLEPWALDEALCRDCPLPPHDAIESRAKSIWERRGRPAGADLEIWLEAQRQFVVAPA